MSTDRELLEAAAKAAGVGGGFADVPTQFREAWLDADGNLWNPLTDDGDALRLAAKLRLNLAWTFGGHGVQVTNADGTWCVESYEATYQPQSIDTATRKAIVRAAAALSPSTDGADAGG